MPKGKLKECKACGSRIKQSLTGRTRLYCDKTCASRGFYRVHTGYRRAAYKKLYRLHADREKARSRERYWRLKHEHDGRRRVVTWKRVELPAVPVSFSPNFSALADPFGFLGDYELRHLLADFEGEDGCLESEQHIHRPAQGDRDRSPMYLDFGDGLPSTSDAGMKAQVR